MSLHAIQIKDNKVNKQPVQDSMKASRALIAFLLKEPTIAQVNEGLVKDKCKRKFGFFFYTLAPFVTRAKN